MKNLKNNSTKMLMLIVLFVFASCKKNRENNEDGAKAGSYTYQGKTVNITGADYRDVGEDGPWIFFNGPSYSDAVQLRFPRAGADIPTGDFVYNGAVYTNGGYKPLTNFNGGMVTTEASILGDAIKGGSVKIKKEGDGFAISFDVTTANGPLKGSFTGTLAKK
ncbi:hypothetical protein ASU31_24380 [Pedobacter ginsenosidimutans]|uniref:Lipocalin-like domain-containing protein n=1 Tax=Pedobacter ginsenosidimutans TaxID=687842 RepID=A0A0T5VI45_9SPHI|nr:hypothetical protein [Pedobacter ginsenosidimutans]KRT13441.1 hypothetical protein ASU31_24380 [Pedobacter ginsenosidimutans]